MVLRGEALRNVGKEHRMLIYCVRSTSTVTTDAELVLLIKPDGMHLVFQSVPVRCF